MAATAILLSGCAGGDVAGDVRRDAEMSVAIGVDHLAKGLADSISSDSIGAQLTADAISRMGVPMLFTFWIYQDVSTSASFVSLSVQVYGCGEW
ncbi:hypothetical protein CQ044_06825 [Microbacterium sp. MYb64]|nr:hypothetical protein CQ044_06825 [Microbacterium sp. MYb64]